VEAQETKKSSDRSTRKADIFFMGHLSRRYTAYITDKPSPGNCQSFKKRGQIYFLNPEKSCA